MFPNFCARQKDGLHSVKLVFCGSTKVFEEALNAVKFLVWLKIFGPAQNILGPVKGQGSKSLTLLRNYHLQSPILHYTPWPYSKSRFEHH